MATETIPSKPKPRRIKRLSIGVNVLAQVAIVAVILVMVNYLAFNHFKRWDLTRDKKYELSGQTKQLLKSLKETVKIIVFFSPTSFSPEVQIYPDVENLLKEYQYASDKKVAVEFVNPGRDFSRARELQAKYKFGANENLIILDYEGRTKVVNASDMAEFDQGNMMIGQPPRLTAFKGEQAVTSALLEVVEAQQNKVYFVTGHGEPDPADQTLSAVKTYIERQNIKLESFVLLNVDVVPEDARAVVIVGPKYDFSEREMQILRTYWEKKGRIFAAIDPAASTPRLTGWLADMGVRPQDDWVMRTLNMGPITGVVRDAIGTFVEGSPITKRLRGANVQFLGRTQSLAVESELARIGNARVQPLIQAAEQFWGETEYANAVETGVFEDPKKDHTGTLNLAVSVERGALKDTRVQVDSSRAVVVGNATFLLNEAITEAGVDFFLGSLNWLLDREELIGIAPKEQKSFTLSLEDEKVRTIALIVLAGIPALIAMLGVVSYLSRRR